MKRLRAYTVHDGDDGCCVRFATNSATARREGANELDTDWTGIDYCHRSPEFDQYAPGPVPPLTLIAAGWWFECHNCGRKVSNDMATDLEEDGLDPDEYAPVADGRRVYCCQACSAIDAAKRRSNLAAQAAMLEVVEAKFPGAMIQGVHVYGEKLEPSEKGHGIRCQASFTFPGAKYGATWIFGEPHTHVSTADIDAFKALYGSRDPIPAT